MTALRQPFRRVEKRLARGRRPMTTAEDSSRLARVRQRGTAPELAVRRVASRLGLRYTLNNRDLPGSPDLANRSKQFVIFVHGCYWHRHAGCTRATTPKNNRAFWEAKFARNVERDTAAVEKLDAKNYRVAVIWECEAADDGRIERALEGLIEPHPERRRAPSVNARNQTGTNSLRHRSNESSQ